MTLDDLLAISSDGLAPPPVRLTPDHLGCDDARCDEISALLHRNNGFYAFESALHVFPDRSTGSELGLDQWNSPQLWRAKYEDMAEGLFFFAEDIFGFQFCIRGGDVCTFNPETGDVEPLARDLHEWAEKILSDYNFLTGYPIGHKWQLIHGPIAPRTRLTPKIPFVLGGEFETENLYAGDVVEAMRFRGHLAIQIRDLPDGSQIEFQITD